jgi:hypothetical protein
MNPLVPPLDPLKSRLHNTLRLKALLPGLYEVPDSPWLNPSVHVTIGRAPTGRTVAEDRALGAVVATKVFRTECQGDADFVAEPRNEE